MFQNCKSLISLDLSNFNFSRITDMTNMFSGCENLQSVKLQNQEYSLNYLYMDNMFSNCLNLRTIDLSKFSIQSNTSLNSMFHYDKLLNNITMPHINCKARLQYLTLVNP